MALYDAFVSYSHAKDKPIAAALQSVVQKLGKSWYRRRALRVFRDDTSLSATPSLWPAIERALGQSRSFILLASPEAAASKWVNREVAHWLEHHGIETLLIGVTDGGLDWDERTGDFGARADMPLPPALTGRFQGEPKWVDLRGHRDGADPRQAKFIELGADFAAAIRGMPKEDLLSLEVRQQRRALTLAWSAAALLLILSGLAGWQWYEATMQRREAIAQRDRAEQTLAAATKTANDLVFELAQRFRNAVGVPTALVKDILDRARALQVQLARSGQVTPELRRSEGAALTELADSLLAIGDTKGAFAAADSARQIFESLLAIDATNIDRQRQLSVSYEKVGDVLVAAGRREEALAAYQKSFAIRQKLADSDPSNADWQRDLSVSYDKIGNVQVAAGQREEALVVYQKGLAIDQKLAASDPGNAVWQRDLSVSHRKIGDVLVAAGRREEALAAYQKSLAIDQRLADSDPGNAVWQRDLSVSHTKIGDVLVAAGRREEALAAYQKSLSIDEKLAASDPGNAAWQRDLATSYDRIGDVLAVAGRHEEALAAYQKGHASFQKLAERDPGNAAWQRDLAVSYNKVGDALVALGRREEALAAYESGLAIAQRLAASDPGNAVWQHDLSISYERIGNVLVVAGRREEALAAYQKSLAIREKLVAGDPGNAGWQTDLVASLYGVSTVAEPAQARAALSRALAILDALASAGKLAAAQQNWPQIFRQALARSQ